VTVATDPEVTDAVVMAAETVADKAATTAADPAAAETADRAATIAADPAVAETVADKAVTTADRKAVAEDLRIIHVPHNLHRKEAEVNDIPKKS